MPHKGEVKGYDGDTLREIRKNIGTTTIKMGSSFAMVTEVRGRHEGMTVGVVFDGVEARTEHPDGLQNAVARGPMTVFDFRPGETITFHMSHGNRPGRNKVVEAAIANTEWIRFLQTSLKGFDVSRLSKAGNVLGKRGQIVADRGLDLHRVVPDSVMIARGGITQTEDSIMLDPRNYTIETEPKVDSLQLVQFGNPDNPEHELLLAPGVIYTLSLPDGVKPGRNGVAALRVQKVE